MKEVASAAPNLPFYYYQIPGLTGVHGQWVLGCAVAAQSHALFHVFLCPLLTCGCLVSDSARERCDRRYRGADSLLQRREVHWD